MNVEIIRRDDRRQGQQHEHHDVPELRLVADTRQCVGSHGPDRNAKRRGAETDHEGVRIGQVDLANLRLHSFDLDDRRNNEGEQIVEQQDKLAADRVGIAIRVRCELRSPTLQRRLKIDKGDEERSVVDGPGILESRNDHPIDRKSTNSDQNNRMAQATRLAIGDILPTAGGSNSRCLRDRCGLEIL